jgi:NTE family protein
MCLGLANSRSPLGLALSAGGARGAYQIGCWKAFRELGLSFQAVSGSSIGALNGALICQGDWNKARDLWMELTRSTIIKPDFGRMGKLAAVAAADLGLLLLPLPKFRLLQYAKYVTSVAKFFSRHGSLGRLRREGLLSIGALKPLIEEHLDMALIRSSCSHLFVVVNGPPGIRRPLGEAQWFRLQNHSDEEAWNILGASMSVPFVFSTVEIDRLQYSDGGVGQWLPLQPLVNAGMQRIIAVSVKASTKVLPETYPGCRVTVVRPRKPMGRFPVATFRFTETAVKRWIEQGYEDALRMLDEEAKSCLK